MTEAEFRKVMRRKPVQDDLERVNCDLAGQPGHTCCGLCEHGRPRFTVCYKCRPELKR